MKAPQIAGWPSARLDYYFRQVGFVTLALQEQFVGLPFVELHSPGREP